MTEIRHRESVLSGKQRVVPTSPPKGNRGSKIMEPNQSVCVMPCTLEVNTDQPLRSRRTDAVIEVKVRVQLESIDVESELSAMTRCRGIEDLATLLGAVRSLADRAGVIALEIGHDADLSERVLRNAVAVVSARWEIDGVSVIHRIGVVFLGEAAALVVASAKCRQAAFSACEFLAKYLECGASFWKREVTEYSIFQRVDTKEPDRKVTLGWS